MQAEMARNGVMSRARADPTNEGVGEASTNEGDGKTRGTRYREEGIAMRGGEGGCKGVVMGGRKGRQDEERERENDRRATHATTGMGKRNRNDEGERGSRW